MNSTGGPQINLPSDKWEAQFAKLARRSQLMPLPSEARQSLMAHFRSQYQANRPTLLSQLSQLIGTLSFDSAAGPQLAGARNTLSAENRQLIYTTEAGDIAFDFEGGPNGVNISGQLYVDQPDSQHLIQLVQNDQAIADVVTHELGEFEFADIPQGTYDIYAVSQTLELHLTGVPVIL